MSHNPLVSIVINNYNYGRFLREAIDSALNQTYNNTEIIVVDDGSTDSSRETIASYGNKIISVLKENGGQASAFNAGFTESQGELVCFLDSDDIWLPNKVESITRVAHENPDAVLIYHRVQPVSGKGDLLGKPWPSVVMQGQLDKRVARSGGWWPYPPTSALCFSRAFLQNVMYIPEHEYRICADAYLADIAPFIGKIVGINNTYTFYRLHGSNYWNDESRLKEEEQAVRAHLARYESRVSGLNGALKRLGVNCQVSLNDHWPYQRLKYKLGIGLHWPRLSWIALRFAGEPNIIKRFKSLLRFWLSVRGLSN